MSRMIDPHQMDEEDVRYVRDRPWLVQEFKENRWPLKATVDSPKDDTDAEDENDEDVSDDDDDDDDEDGSDDDEEDEPDDKGVRKSEVDHYRSQLARELDKEIIRRNRGRDSNEYIFVDAPKHKRDKAYALALDDVRNG